MARKCPSKVSHKRGLIVTANDMKRPSNTCAWIFCNDVCETVNEGMQLAMWPRELQPGGLIFNDTYVCQKCWREPTLRHRIMPIGRSSYEPPVKPLCSLTHTRLFITVTHTQTDMCPSTCNLPNQIIYFASQQYFIAPPLILFFSSSIR